MLRVATLKPFTWCIYAFTLLYLALAISTPSP